MEPCGGGARSLATHRIVRGCLRGLLRVSEHSPRCTCRLTPETVFARTGTEPGMSVNMTGAWREAHGDEGLAFCAILNNNSSYNSTRTHFGYKSGPRARSPPSL